MPEYVLTRKQWIPRAVEDVFRFFSRAENLQELTPPWLNFKIVETSELRAGALIRYRLRIHGVPIRWVSEITDWDPPRRFVDVQRSGPYQIWHHEHSFTAEREGTTMTDRVNYALRFGPLGRMAHWVLVRRDVEKIFEYRSARMQELFG